MLQGKKHVLMRRFVVLLIFCGVLAGIVVYKRIFNTATSIPPIGGDMELSTLLMISSIYLQTDERWQEETIGGSGERIRAVGCMICCVAMSLTYHGIRVDPAALNSHLKQNDGYTDQGWVIWGAITALSDDIHIDLPQRPTHQKIDSALKEKTPVIAKILLKGRIPHWVLIIGKHAGQYLVIDPLGDGTTVDVLSHFNSNIYAIRVIYGKRIEGKLNNDTLVIKI